MIIMPLNLIWCLNKSQYVLEFYVWYMFLCNSIYKHVLGLIHVQHYYLLSSTKPKNLNSFLSQVTGMLRVVCNPALLSVTHADRLQDSDPFRTGARQAAWMQARASVRPVSTDSPESIALDDWNSFHNAVESRITPADLYELHHLINTGQYSPNVTAQTI